MFGHLCVLLLSFNTQIINGLDLPQGCEVQNVLKIDPVKYDSVRFNAFVDDSKMVFNAKMVCNAGASHDFLALTANHSVTLETVNWKGQSDPKVFEANVLAPGWHSFDLKLINHYALEDDRGQSLIPEGEADVTCKVEEVTLSEGILMRHCPENVPTWVVSGAKVREIPVVALEDQVQTEEFTFFSRSTFRPVLSVGKQLLYLGWVDSKLQVEDTKPDTPLPNFAQHRISLQLTDNSEENPKVKILDESNKELKSFILKERPTTVGVKGSQGDHFVVLQTLKDKRFQGQETFENASAPFHGVTDELRTMRNTSVFPDLLVIGLVAGLAVSVSVICMFIARDIRRHVTKNKVKRCKALTSAGSMNRGNKDNEAAQKAPEKRSGYESMYLRPISHVPLRLPLCPPKAGRQKPEELPTEPAEYSEPTEYSEPLYEEFDSAVCVEKLEDDFSSQE